MTKEEARQFKENWAAVNQVVIEEARRASLEERLQALNALYLAARSFGWDERLRAEEEIVRERWQRLKARASGEGNRG